MNKAMIHTTLQVSFKSGVNVVNPESAQIVEGNMLEFTNAKFFYKGSFLVVTIFDYDELEQFIEVTYYYHLKNIQKITRITPSELGSTNSTE